MLYLIFDNQTANTTLTINQLPILIIDPITLTTGQTINITARIKVSEETLTDINNGKVTFKVSGKTLKDTNGKVIYAKVVNGTATIENYLVPESWDNDTTTQAVYSGSSDMAKMFSEKTFITITPKELTITSKDVQATLGTTVNLIATLNDKSISTGKIVFKINGKTVKDANGKVIYAKVVNGQVSVEYTIPENMKAGSYNIAAVYIPGSGEKLENTKTLTVTS